VSPLRSEFRVDDEDRGAVRVLTLNRPDKLNAFTSQGYRALTERLAAAAADPNVAVCVLTGSGRAFSAGVDLTEMTEPGGKEALGASFDPLLAVLARFPKPLIAAVNGLAVGFGATILLHCDVVVVDEHARIRLPFVELGTCAEAASSWLLPSRVGGQLASWMVLSATTLSAGDALRIGLALAQTPEGQVVEEAMVLAQQVAAHRVAALVANKALLRNGWADMIDEVWQREKAAMMSLAEELGSIGWSIGSTATHPDPG